MEKRQSGKLARKYVIWIPIVIILLLLIGGGSVFGLLYYERSIFVNKMTACPQDQYLAHNSAEASCGITFLIIDGGGYIKKWIGESELTQISSGDDWVSSQVETIELDSSTPIELRSDNETSLLAETCTVVKIKDSTLLSPYSIYKLTIYVPCPEEGLHTYHHLAILNEVFDIGTVNIDSIDVEVENAIRVGASTNGYISPLQDGCSYSYTVENTSESDIEVLGIEYVMDGRNYQEIDDPKIVPPGNSLNLMTSVEFVGMKEKVLKPKILYRVSGETYCVVPPCETSYITDLSRDDVVELLESSGTVYVGN